jgi:TetR/AcrR family transcriptional repressor of bet genes
MPEKDASPAKPRKERKENAERRRRQLLDATMRSVVANGLAKTTLATVANEAGLSQGVAVFYYKSKNGLLTALLEEIYHRYDQTWRSHLEQAGADPVAQMRALIQADFSQTVCSPEHLCVWFAFWGEQKFTPQYAEITSLFDTARAEAIQGVCRQFFPEEEQELADELAEWVDVLTDGYWQKIHLFPREHTLEQSMKTAFRLLDRMIPGHDFGAT